MISEAAPLAAFAFAASITPGPNNLMLMSSGARFGLRRTLPHVIGVTFGFGVLALCVGQGLAQILQAAPALEVVMKAASAVFILYLAYKIARSGQAKAKTASDRPMSLLSAAAFQWINPKAWAMALTAMTVYAPSEASFLALVATAGLFCAVNLPCCSAWAATGGAIARRLKAPGRQRAFNCVMAGLLVLSMAPLLL